MKEKNFVSAVIYLHNNQNSILTFLNELNDTLSAHFHSFEVICVDDMSSDGTIESIQSAKKMPGSKFSVVRMSHHHGPEAAMNAGIDLAIGDFVFEFECPVMDYNPTLIMELYRKALTGHDIVSACAKQRLSLGPRMFYALFNRCARMQHKLRSDTFRILSRRAINRVHSMNKTVPYRKAAYASCGLSMCFIQYETTGKSISPREPTLNSLLLFTEAGYTLAKWITFSLMLFTFAVGSYAVTIFLRGGAVEGWTTTMLLISAGFFGLFAILTIVIKYLSIITSLVFTQQKYLVAGIDKLN